MQIWIDNRYTPTVLAEKTLRGCVAHILESLQQSEGEISIVLTDDAEIARLNRQYLNRAAPTNVMAFPMRGGEGEHVSPSLLGDVVVSLDTAREEASRAGVPWAERLVALIIHGILHLMGHDHVDDEGQARRMEREERRLLKQVKERFRDLETK